MTKATFLSITLMAFLCLFLLKTCRASEVLGLNWNGGVSDPYSAKKAGDIENNGFKDSILHVSSAVHYQGAVYVIYGEESSSFGKRNLNSKALNSDEFKDFIKTIGDINNDGYDDIILIESAQRTIKSIRLF